MLLTCKTVLIGYCFLESLYLKKEMWKDCMNAETQNHTLELWVFLRDFFSFHFWNVDIINRGMKFLFVCIVWIKFLWTRVECSWDWICCLTLNEKSTLTEFSRLFLITGKHPGRNVHVTWKFPTPVNKWNGGGGWRQLVLNTLVEWVGTWWGYVCI